MATLFVFPAEFSANRFILKIETDSGDHTKIHLSLLGPDAVLATRTLTLSQAHSLDHASFSFDSLSEVIKLDVALTPAERSALLDAGLAGFNFAAGATLKSVSIVLRPRPQGGTWSSATPCFALMMCWTLNAQAREALTLGSNAANGEASVKLGAVATAEVCAGFSVISPEVATIGFPHLQLRLDVPSFSMTTNWLPLADIFGIGHLPHFQVDGLLAWFGSLVGFTWGAIGTPQLPNWSFPNLKLEIDLPLGIGAKKTSLALNRDAGCLVLSASASDFYLSWNGAQMLDLGGRMELTYADGHYTFFAELLRKQYPASVADGPYTFTLPFDLLGISADCWFFRAGLYAGGQIGDSVQLCFEVLLEIGGLELRSSLTGDEGSKGFYHTDLRILMRDFAVLSNSMKAPENALSLFALVTNSNARFDKYKTKNIPALSFAADLFAPPLDPALALALANDYGMEFLDGDFRAGERIYILWRQKGLRFMRALAHDLLGQEPAGQAGADEPSTLFGLEIAKLKTNGASASQMRLDWRPEEATLPVAPPVLAAPPAPAFVLDDDGVRRCILAPVNSADPLLVTLPIGSDAVDLAHAPRNAATLNLPGISLQVSRPTEQAIVVRREADQRASVSHLVFFPSASAPGGLVPAIARVRVGFSLENNTGAASGREVMETDGGNTLLTVGLGYAGGTPVALRTIGWASGEGPRFLQVQPNDAQPFTSLLPPAAKLIKEGDPGCPGAPPQPKPVAQFDFNGFCAPQLAPDKWRLSIQVAAGEALFKMFNGASGGQKVSFRIVKICESNDGQSARITTAIHFELGSDFSAEGNVTLLFNVHTLALSVADGAELAVQWPRVDDQPVWAADTALPGGSAGYEYSASHKLMGFEMTALAPKSDPGPPPAHLSVLLLSICDGRFLLSLPKNGSILLRYTGLGKDSLNFWVSVFELGPGGLDLEASLLSSTVTVKGLSRPFLLEKASLRVRASCLDYLSVDASGKLPELFNEAPVKLTIAFAQREANGPIDLDEMHCELGDKDAPLFSRGTRFKFELTNLTIQYASDAPGGERYFYFEVSGSAQFTPDTGEFESGLLENLKEARIEFLRAPLSDEFQKNLSLIVELKKPVTFDVFGLFSMEIRSIGFEPHCTLFDEPGPAIVIGGQCKFAKIGDVISADIAFHAMRIGMPKRGESLPQVHFDGLRVDIYSPEGFHIGGRVDRYDSRNLEGFAGEGTIGIPGFPELSAAFSFVRLREKETDSWQHAWFVAIEAAKISYQVAPLPLYLRQIGLGFGYRFTLPLIAAFDTPKASMRELINVMLKALDNHQTLARIDSWTAKPGPAQWTIALEAVFTLGTANTGPFAYDAENEKKLKTMVVQTLAAFRSDFTIMAAIKMWYPVSVDDFFLNLENMHGRPLVSGFMIYSVPQSRLLAHAAKGKDPYMGPKDDPVPEMLKDILRGTHFEATLLIEPGLIHGELGWPDRLLFGMKMGSLEIECRGGLLFRLERDLLIQGTFFSARGSVNLGGGLDAGFIGCRVEAFVQVQFAARLLTAVYLANPLDSKVYAALGLDIAVRFAVSAWLHLKIGFFKIDIDISFSINLQIVVALELGWAGYGNVGFKGNARVSIGVFGRSIGVGIAVGVNESGVEKAREVLYPYMGSLLGPGEAPPMPGLDSIAPRIAAPEVFVEEESAKAAPTVLGIPAEIDVLRTYTPKHDDFVSAHVEGASQGTETLWFVWIMPTPGISAFYPVVRELGGKSAVEIDYASFEVPAQAGAVVFTWQGGKWTALTGGTPATLHLKPNAGFDAVSETGGDMPRTLTLQQMIAGCWMPTDPVDYEHLVADEPTPFPEYWPPAADIGLSGPSQRVYNPDDDIRDERVQDQSHAQSGPNRRLDVSHPYDKALLEARKANGLDAAGRDTVAQLDEQAHGNQHLLIQAFHDDLVTIAGSTTFDAKGDPVTGVPGSTKRPTLLDTGMLICVKSATRPEWIGRRNQNAGIYPRVKFLASAAHAGVEFVVQPVVDFDKVDFHKYPPVFNNATPYFDEDIIALAWDLDWGGDPPEFAEGADTHVESYLRCYIVRFVDLVAGKVVREVTTTPSACDTPAEGGGLAKLRLRYQFTIARAEVSAGLPQYGTNLLAATVTPVSQSGHEGAPFTFDLAFTPTLTPMPADDAQFDLASPDHGASWEAELRWRQLALPPRPGIATTEGWHLILRPLRAVPLGAYPDEAVDVTDRGLMSVTGQALLDGDIVIKLPRHDLPNEVGFSSYAPPIDKDNDRDPAELHLSLRLKKNVIPGTVYDHRGLPQKKGTALHTEAERFFTHTPASHEHGRGWRLFLRAANELNSDERLQRGLGLSGLSQVRLLLRAHSGSESGMEPPLLRTLGHLEWPQAAALPQSGAVVGAGGTLQLPVAVGTLASAQIKFVDKPGRQRAITVGWNALDSTQKNDKPAFPLQAYAAYDVFELDLVNLINADLVASTGFSPDWQWLKRIHASDAALAAQQPNSMADVANWEAQYPVFARTVGKLADINIAPRDMQECWPGWYSWDESQLEWPPSASEELAPKSQLGKWLELGRGVAKVRIHDYLALLLGQMAANAGTGMEARYEIQVSAGSPTTVTHPVKWLAANTETTDPYGWAALAHLGLAVTVALRAPFTGLLEPQSAITDAIALAVAAVRAAAEIGTQVTQVELWQRHLMFDLPVQNLRAYVAPGQGGALKDAALSMLQVSLRPVPEQVAHYYAGTVGDVPKKNEKNEKNEDIVVKPDDASLRVDIRFAHLRPGQVQSATVTLTKGSALRLADVFVKGDFVLIREFGAGQSFVERLKSAGLGWTAQPGYEEMPFALLPPKLSDMLKSPFETFGTDQEVWEARLQTESGAKFFAAFLDRLARSFALSSDDTDVKAVEALLRSEDQAQLHASYMTWSQRFFRTAPIVALHDANCAIAQPKSADPMHVAADTRGRLSYTRFVEEQLAGERSYAILPVGRYQRLLRAMNRDPNDDDDIPLTLPQLADARADVALPRVRRLDPPKLLAARAISGSDGRQFHELLMAHAELDLCEQNTSVMRKLVFGDIQRAYLRRFRHAVWARTLGTTALFADLRAGLPQPAQVRAVDNSPPDDIDGEVETLLAEAPQARWNSTRYVDAAEPYYYEQRVRYRATAGDDVASETRVVVLPTPQPGALFALKPNPVVTEYLALNTIWSNRLEEDPVASWLNSSSPTVTVRWPRLIESLEPGALASYFADEQQRYQYAGKDYAAVGYLPDPELRILLIDQSAAATATIAQWRAVPQTDPLAAPLVLTEMFSFTSLAADFNVTALDPQVQVDWAAGVHVCATVNADVSAWAVGLNEADVGPIALPTNLVDFAPDTSLSFDQLPAAGALTRLAALALRLRVLRTVGSVTASAVEPLSGPRWLCRPHLDSHAQPKGESLRQADLAVGLRMLLDPERRRCGALVAWDVEHGGPDAGLLRRIEECDLALMLNQNVPLPYEAELMQQWARAGITVWRRTPDANATDGGAWQQLLEKEIDPVQWQCLIYKKTPFTNAGIEAGLEQIRGDAWASVLDFVPDPANFVPQRTFTLNDRLDELARLSYRPAPLRAPDVYVQRGNDVRTLWTTRPEDKS